MRLTAKIVGSALALLVGAVLVLTGAMYLSEDVRYGVVYALMEHADLNPPIPAAQLSRQIAALKRANVVDRDGKPLDWNKSPRAIVWVNEWANWCVPCRMEFPAMKALQNRVGSDKLRIILLSQPRYWEADKRLAKVQGIDFELATIKDARESDLAAINFSRHGNSGFIMPEHSFFRADGRGIEAMHTVRDWDSTAWATIIEHWYGDGVRQGRRPTG